MKVYLYNGDERWLLLHTEIQGQNSKNFPLRMFTYNYRLFDRFRVNVATLVVFTGKQNQQQFSEYRSDVLGTETVFRYRTYQIFDHTEGELLAMENPFALIVLAAQKEVLADRIPEEQLGKDRLTVARALIASEKYGKEQIIRFIFFLKNFIHIENEEINRIFDEEVLKLIGGQENMGIIETIVEQTREESEAKGKLEGILEERAKAAAEKREIAREMKKEDIPAIQIAKFTKLTLEEIKNL